MNGFTRDRMVYYISAVYRVNDSEDVTVHEPGAPEKEPVAAPVPVRLIECRS